MFEFQGDESAGVTETAYYFQPIRDNNPFYDYTKPEAQYRQATRCYILTEDNATLIRRSLVATFLQWMTAMGLLKAPHIVSLS